MAELRIVFRNAIFTLVFISAILLFAFNFQNENNVSNESSIANPNGYFDVLNNSFTNIGSNGTGFGASYQSLADSVNATMQSPSVISFGWVIWNGIISFGQIMIKLPIAMFSAIGGVATAVLGIPPYYTLLIGLAITVGLIILLYRLWRQGS